MGEHLSLHFPLDGHNVRCHYTYMGVKLVRLNKKVYSDGSIMEMNIWQVPISQRHSRGYKYSLVYIKNGERIIGYDNAEGKGDHRHYYSHEEPYTFMKPKTAR